MILGLLPGRFWSFVLRVKLKTWRSVLKLTHTWAIARGLQPDGGGGIEEFEVLFAELTDRDGVRGIGEAAPSSRYQENVDTVAAFLEHVDPERLNFEDVAGSMAYLERVAPKQHAAKGAINLALLDGAARRAGRPVYDFLGLGFQENKHVTSFSIGIAKPDVIRRKVQEAEIYPVLKMKVGSPDDAQNLAALREVAPTKRVRVDANEAWKTKEEALRKIEWLAADGHIEFVEQPMPASTEAKDLIWLKGRSPLPIMADESCISVEDIPHCSECYHSINVKLVKTGGISGAFETLKAARSRGLKTMIGCMIESSVLISAAAHLAELTDYLDLDGNLLISNDPYRGVSCHRGMLSFADAPEPVGLRVQAR